MINKKTFSLYKRTTSAFRLMVSGFTETLTWSNIFYISHRIIAAFKSSLSNSADIAIGLLLNIAIQTSNGIYPTVEIRALMQAAAKLYKKIYADMKVKVTNNYIIHQLYKPLIALNGIKITVVQSCDIDVARFRILSYFDGSTLGTLDSLTLGDMDKEVA